MHKQGDCGTLTTVHAVLFDLDGTLIDTAPDMVQVLQEMQRAHGREPVDYATGRSFVSNGSLGLVKLGFGEQDKPRRSELQEEYLQRYANQLSKHSCLFEGLDPLLQSLESSGGRWGVVTNKPAFLTEPLMRDLALEHRSAAIVSGDTLPQRKPDPAPVLHACEIAGIDPARTLFVGDALRDIEAGKGAGMTTIAAGYGYIVDGDDPGAWGADIFVDSVEELCQVLSQAFRL